MRVINVCQLLGARNPVVAINISTLAILSLYQTVSNHTYINK